MYTFDKNSGFYLKSDALRKPAMMEVSSGVGLKGEFRAMLYNADGSLAHDSGWNSNIIVDNAAYLYDSWYDWYVWCTIGSSAVAPTTTDTSIGAFLAAQSSSTNPLQYTAYPRPPTGPDYGTYSVKKWRFEAGAGTGNVNEFTLGEQNNGTNIFCRHVLPATIPKAADQSLDIYYRIWVYLDLTPRTGTVTIKGVSYDWESSFYNYTGNPNSNLFAHYDLNSTFNSNFRAWPTGVTKGTPSADPTPNVYALNASKAFLSQGAWYRVNRLTVELDWMVTSNKTIQLITATDYQGHKLQIEFLDTATRTTGFPKDETEEMTIDWRTTWARWP